LLATILRIRDHINGNHPSGHLPYQLEDIRKAVLAVTNVDEIEFVRYDEPNNPIKGRYLRYDLPEGLYGQVKTRVEVHYAADLNYCWRRFVICKELCHSLEEDGQTKVVTPAQMEKLIETLLLPAASLEALAAFPPFRAEKIAEFSALEILCPVEQRRLIVDKRIALGLSDLQIASRFRVPVVYAKRMFEPGLVTAVEQLFESVRRLPALSVVGGQSGPNA
jgi:hypothetical protein